MSLFVFLSFFLLSIVSKAHSLGKPTKGHELNGQQKEGESEKKKACYHYVERRVYLGVKMQIYTGYEAETWFVC